MSWLSALIACGAGLVACPVYSALRFVARKAGFTAVSILLDAVFGLLAAGSIVAIAFFFNDGIVKFYMLLAAACGFLLAKLFATLIVKPS